jgi:hypothetical protein
MEGVGPGQENMKRMKDMKEGKFLVAPLFSNHVNLVNPV